jgi:hypothetical protein
MVFIVERVRNAAEFDEIWPMHFQAFQNPYNSFSKFFNPVHTTIDAAIEISKARHVAMWKDDPASHWIKVIDKETKQVIGAALWDLNQSGYTTGDGDRFKASFKATQHVEGSEERLFAEKLIGGLRSTVMETIKGPHMGEHLLGILVHRANLVRVEANGCTPSAPRFGGREAAHRLGRRIGRQEWLRCHSGLRTVCAPCL